MFNCCKRVLYLLFYVILVMSVTACNDDSTNSIVNKETIQISESIEDVSVQEQIEVYSGPGIDYVFICNIDKDDITRAVKIEKEWVEIEFGTKRGYIKKEIVPELCTDKIPRVVYNISQNVYPYPVVYNINIPISLFDSAKTYYVPKGDSFSELSAGETVTILCSEESGFFKYAQIEINTDGEKRRCYAGMIDLLSLDNPLLNFESVKNANAVISYECQDYYSSSGEASVALNDWIKRDEKIISKTEFDFLSGIVNVIASNDINEEMIKATEGKIYLYSFKDKQYINANTKNEKVSNLFSVFDFFMNGSISFMEGSISGINLKIELDEYNGEYKIVIKTGIPLESKYAGKKISLSSLIVEKNNTALTMLQSSDKEDEFIKSMYPDLDQNKKYTMEMTFSKDFSDNNYGFYLVVDKKLNIYATPIIHPGTSFAIYSEGKFICDAALDVAMSMIQIDEESSNKILNLLYENGFIISGFRGVETSVPNEAVEYNGHHYYLFSNMCETWEEAKTYCENMGGYLAIINDDAENIFLYDLMKQAGHENAYFGLTDRETEGVWKCVDGSEPEYTNWSYGEPNNERGVEHYAMFYYKSPEYQWNDGDFNHGTTNDNATFICEWNQ